MRKISLFLFAAWWAGLTAVAGEVTFGHDQLTLVLNPALGRIVELRTPTVKNLIWMNPTPEEGKLNGWVNWGGEKLWWGPQEDWARVTGVRWPVDPAIDLEWSVTDQTAERLALRGRVSEYQGVRAEREIRLLPEVTGFVVQTTLRREVDKPHRIQPWAVAQVRPPEWCWMDCGTSEGAPYLDMRPGLDPKPFVHPVEGQAGLLRVQACAGVFMIGTGGRWLAAVYPDVVLVQIITSPRRGQYLEGVSLQLFSADPYVELETLGGVETPAVGESTGYDLTWLLLPRPAGLDEVTLVQQVKAEVAKWLPAN